VSVGEAAATAIALDADANIYTTGSFSGNVDFDPSFSVHTLSASGYNIFIQSMDKDGNYRWTKDLKSGNTNYNYGTCIYVDDERNIYLGGHIDYAIDMDPGQGTFFINAYSAPGDNFLAKYCQTPESPISILGNTLHCAGLDATFSVAPAAGATFYTWTLPAGWSGSSLTSSITIGSGPTGGVISVKSGNGCGLSSPVTMKITDCTGEIENGFLNKIEVFPNPANGKFYLRSPESRNFTLRIFDNNGILVLCEDVRLDKTEKKEIELKQKGIYFVSLVEGNDIVAGKIIME
jgi:hypothetical protein